MNEKYAQVKLDQNCPGIGVKLENMWNHHLDIILKLSQNTTYHHDTIIEVSDFLVASSSHRLVAAKNYIQNQSRREKCMDDHPQVDNHIFLQQ